MAQRHPTRRKISSEKPDVSEDALVAGVFELSEWARKHSQTLILTGVAALLVLGGGLYYASYKRDLNRRATMELERVSQVAMFVPAEAEPQLTQFMQTYGSTRHATEARLLLAQVQMSQGKADQAIVTLEEVSGDDPLELQARALLGRAYEEVGRQQDAEGVYLSLSKDATLDFQRRDALADAARVRSRLGNHAGAAELYKQILDGLEEDDAQRGAYEMRLAEEENLKG
jgi:predicted negative regulator of RcsB-dependent stress response